MCHPENKDGVRPLNDCKTFKEKYQPCFVWHSTLSTQMQTMPWVQKATMYISLQKQQHVCLTAKATIYIFGCKRKAKNI